MRLAIDQIVGVFAEPLGDPQGLGIEAGVLFVGRAGAADNQGDAGFVDHDRVDLVDDGDAAAGVKTVLRPAAAAEDFAIVRSECASRLRDAGELFAEIVESEFVAGAINDVAGVDGPLLFLGAVLFQQRDRAIQQAIDGGEQFAVALGKVGVWGGHVDALAAQSVEDRRQGGAERLSFAGGHFRRSCRGRAAFRR